MEFIVSHTFMLLHLLLSSNVTCLQLHDTLLNTMLQPAHLVRQVQRNQRGAPHKHQHARQHAQVGADGQAVVKIIAFQQSLARDRLAIATCQRQAFHLIAEERRVAVPADRGRSKQKKRFVSSGAVRDRQPPHEPHGKLAFLLQL